jgi:hypothetical protein
MSIKNPLVYTQMHPLAFIVKLRIELSMAKLIRKVAVQKNDLYNSPFELSATTGKGNTATVKPTPAVLPRDGAIMHKAGMVDNQSAIPNGSSVIRGRASLQEDEESLRNDSWQRVVYIS